MDTRFILIQPSHAGNIGAAARAIKVMGFDELVLVQPRWDDVLTREETIERASGAVDVLQKARAVDTLDEALDGLSYLSATVMTARDFGPPTWAPREHLARVAQGEHSVGFLFGSERYGMRNEDVYRCHAALQIPVSAQYGSLNLAAAIQVIAYEWRLALGGFAPGLRQEGPASPTVHPELVGGRAQPSTGSARTGGVGGGASQDAGASQGGGAARTVEGSARTAGTLADARSVAGMLAHWEQALADIGFLDPAAPKKLMPRLNQLFNRAQPTPEEIHILRGVAKAMSEAAKKPRP